MYALYLQLKKLGKNVKIDDKNDIKENFVEVLKVINDNFVIEDLCHKALRETLEQNQIKQE